MYRLFGDTLSGNCYKVQLLLHYLGEDEAKRAGGYRALEVMEKHLDAASFFVGGHLTVADISLYAYTHVAHEGGFSLDRFPAVRSPGTC